MTGIANSPSAENIRIIEVIIGVTSITSLQNVSAAGNKAEVPAPIISEPAHIAQAKLLENSTIIKFAAPIKKRCIIISFWLLKNRVKTNVSNLKNVYVPQ